MSMVNELRYFLAHEKLAYRLALAEVKMPLFVSDDDGIITDLGKWI